MKCGASLWLINRIIFVFSGFLTITLTKAKQETGGTIIRTGHLAQDTVPGDQRKIKFSDYFRRKIRLFVSNTQGAAEYSSQLFFFKQKQTNKQKNKTLLFNSHVRFPEFSFRELRKSWILLEM